MREAPRFHLLVVVIAALCAVVTSCSVEAADETFVAAEPVDLDRCLDDPELRDCAELLDGLSDAEYCGLLPDDEFCVDFLDGLDDAEYCQVLPDDEFCADLSDDSPEPTEPPAPTDAAAPTSAPPAGPASGTGLAVAGIDPALTRPDGQCLPDDDAELDQEGIEFNLAYQVVEGTLGAICFGSPDATVEQAWRILADLTPPDQLRDLSVFAGFSSTEGADSVTLAFVQGLDDDGDQFLMAVNIAETEADPDEATLTMAHEFTHVFTALPSELDRTVFPGDCTTFDNGEGCYLDESIINQWYERFWPDAPGDPTDEGDADQRCEVDPGFFGSYAASTPEEDFAESFSAYVLGVEARTAGQQARLDFIDTFPGLREFRDRAGALGYGPLEHRFDACG